MGSSRTPSCRRDSSPRWTTTSGRRPRSPYCTTPCGTATSWSPMAIPLPCERMLAVGARDARRARAGPAGRAVGVARPASSDELTEVVDGLVKALLEQRQAARERKDYAAVGRDPRPAQGARRRRRGHPTGCPLDARRAPINRRKLKCQAVVSARAPSARSRRATRPPGPAAGSAAGSRAGARRRRRWTAPSTRRTSGRRRRSAPRSATAGRRQDRKDTESDRRVGVRPQPGGRGAARRRPGQRALRCRGHRTGRPAAGGAADRRRARDRRCSRCRGSSSTG